MAKKAMYILFMMFAASQAKDEELPLCPTDIQYFPQNIPMHCRLPNGADFASLRHNVPTGNFASMLKNIPTVIPPNANMMSYQSPPPNKQPNPVPVPFPGMMPGQMPLPLPGHMPGMMPVPGPGPAHKLPVIVMPFYAPDASYKKPALQSQYTPLRKRRLPKKRRQQPLYSDDDSSDTDTDFDSSDTDTSSDTSTGRDYWKGVKKVWKKNARNSRRSFRRKHKKKELLTPVLQYVTRDGYVIFEKTISKGEASDWLNVKKKTEEEKKKNGDDVEPYDQHNHDEDNEHADHEHDNHDHDDHEHDHDDERRPVEKEQSIAARNKKHVHPTRPIISRDSELNKGLKKP